MEKKEILLAVAEMPTQEIEDIISFGKDELELRNNKDWYEAINEIMTAIQNLKNLFPLATCYVEYQIDEDMGDFDLLDMFEAVTEDSFQR